MQTCPRCKGKKKISVELVSEGISSFDMNCPTCNGVGGVTRKRAQEYQDMTNAWCSCGNDSGETTYVPDNFSSACLKHHWICNDCGKIVQVG